MNHRLLICLSCIAILPLQAQETAEPTELTRLREQFHHQIERELEPLRAIYRKELEKLEQRMVRQDRLADALVIRKERQKVDPLVGGDPEVETEKIRTAEELEEYMSDSIWVALPSKGNRLEVEFAYHFQKDGKMINLGDRGVTAWQVIGNRTIQSNGITWEGTGKITLNDDLTEATISIPGRSSKIRCQMVGRIDRGTKK
jgi:hypothetical protein